jgi:hypothetical protein
MPEKGWSLLTVRSKTALTVKELAKSEGLTVDKFINETPNFFLSDSIECVANVQLVWSEDQSHKPVEPHG